MIIIKIIILYFIQITHTDDLISSQRVPGRFRIISPTLQLIDAMYSTKCRTMVLLELQYKNVCTGLRVLLMMFGEDSGKLTPKILSFLLRNIHHSKTYFFSSMASNCL